MTILSDQILEDVYDPVSRTLRMADAGASGGATTESIQDTVAAFLTAGTNITLTYNDPSNTLTIDAAGSSSTEAIQDMLASFLVAGTNVTLTYDDTANTLTIDSAGAGSNESIQDMLSSFLVAGANVTLTYDDTANTLTVDSVGGTDTAALHGGVANTTTAATKVTTTPASGLTRTGVVRLDSGLQSVQSITASADLPAGAALGTNEAYGSPLALQYDVEYTGTPSDGIVGAVTYGGFTNPWVSGGATYGEQPEGPRSILSVEGTTQWNQSSGNSGSAPPLLNIWYTYKNKTGVARNLGSNALTQLTPMFLADDATCGFATIPDVIAPNVASEYATTTFKGYWGWMSNPWHGTIGSGQLAASTATSVGFMSEAMFMGNVQWGSVHDVELREVWIANGLDTQSAITPTVDTHVGVYMQPFSAAATNLSMVLNNGVRLLDVDRTFTIAPFVGNGVTVAGGAFLSLAGTHTLDFANATMGVLIQQSAEIRVNHDASAIVLGATVQDNNTYRNVSGQAKNLGTVNVISASHTFNANNATINLGTSRTVHSTPSYTKTGVSGAYTGTNEYIAFDSDMSVASGLSITNRYGFRFNEVTSGGHTVNNYAIYIDPLLSGTARNVGIMNGSTTVYKPAIPTLAANTDQIGIVSTNATLNNTTGAAVTLISTPSIVEGGMDGTFAWIVNTETDKAVTVQDSRKLSGSGVMLQNAETTIIPQYGSMPVMWNTALNKWLELGRPGIVPDGRVNLCTSLVGVTVLRYYGGQNTFSLERSGGTFGSPSAVTSGNVLASVQFSGVRTVSGTTGTTAAGAVIQATTTQAWTGSHNGTKLELYTTPDDSTTNTVALTLDQDQSLTPGNTSGTKTNFKIGYSTRRYARSFYR